jgi:hypothetical protein
VIPPATRFSRSVRVAIEANAIAVTAAESEHANSNCVHRADDIRPRRRVGTITASASNPTGDADVSPA